MEEVKTEQKKEKISKEFFESCIKDMGQAIENLDMLRMESILAEIEKYELEENQEMFYKQIAVAIEEYDAYACEDILNEWKKTM